MGGENTQKQQGKGKSRLTAMVSGQH